MSEILVNSDKLKIMYEGWLGGSKFVLTDYYRTFGENPFAIAKFSIESAEYGNAHFCTEVCGTFSVLYGGKIYSLDDGKVIPLPEGYKAIYQLPTEYGRKDRFILEKENSLIISTLYNGEFDISSLSFDKYDEKTFEGTFMSDYALLTKKDFCDCLEFTILVKKCKASASEGIYLNFSGNLDAPERWKVPVVFDWLEIVIIALDVSNPEEIRMTLKVMFIGSLSVELPDGRPLSLNKLDTIEVVSTAEKQKKYPGEWLVTNYKFRTS